MPDEYISREAAVKAANEWVSEACMAPVMRVSRLFDKLAKVPAADVAEVVHGRWIKDDFLSDDVNNAEKCSRCGELIGWFGILPNYCPNCGAKMDGGNDNVSD